MQTHITEHHPRHSTRSGASFLAQRGGASRRCGFVSIEDLEHSFSDRIMTLTISTVKRLEIMSYFFWLHRV